ncbi:cuticular protein RR-2 motif 132 isoform X1 [Bombyx mori]|uniref:Putative cuticle protein n=1 Tax=Bombyx mori TaxID=7091 RepID=C0H6X4_BOMMO|nr:cuticular protein RR-2 motif 132 precursor [Bombyx mori]XP_037875532.1 cuticular protein RR-2 motif 132 isoform X1 [Bombyx mori]FAA00635.1 TPA: putative cuticle protein [Bombyx mori]
MILLLIILVGQSRCQEVTTPSSLLGPKHYNYHAFDAERYLKSLNLPVPTKQGPVLFPNDAPPAPRTPLVVTSRPLIESIAKSDLNPLPQNNTEAQPSSNGVSFVPFFGKVNEYRPFFGAGPGKPHVNRFENQSPLPPIYRVINEHKVQNKKPYDYDYKVKSPEYNQHDNEIHDENNSDYNHAQNYAFSYTVKDKDTGDDFSHSQHSRGAATNGEYRVRLPDGRMQIVSYTADENGYNAEVRYDDEDKASVNAIDINNDNYNSINTNTVKPTDYINVITDYRKTNYDRGNNFNNYISTTRSYDDDVINSNKIANNDNDYGLNDYAKLKNQNEYVNYDSKEFYNDDYSSELNSNYPSYISKFKSFADDKINDNYQVVTSTSKPNFDDIRNLLIDEKTYNTRQSYNDIEPNSQSTLKDNSYNPVNFKKSNLYTNIDESIAITPRNFVTNPFVATTPSSYLVSTITNLQNRISSRQPIPILSGRFIDKINKYLSYK